MSTVGTSVLVQRDLNIRQGSDCTWSFIYSQTIGGVLVANTFSGWSARSQIRDRIGGTVWLAQALTVSASANKLTVTGHIPAATTESAEWNSRDYGVWDVELVAADGTVIPLAGGSVFVNHDVTRA